MWSSPLLHILPGAAGMMFSIVDNWTLELNDEGHVEFASAVIDIHKTMFFASKAPKVMELIAPGAGVAEGCWVSTFLQVRELLGATYKEGYPTMPAPDQFRPAYGAGS